ncbi:Rab family GTPase [Entamoeba marina]
MTELKPITISIGLCGDSSVGKTGIFKRYITGAFNPTEKASISCDVSCKKVVFDGVVYNMQLWDTAGQEVFRSITASYFRNRHAMLFCFDVSKRVAFSSISGWLREFQQNQNNNFTTALLLVGCKTDLDSIRQVTTSEAEQFALDNSMSYCECSAKGNIGVEELFLHAVDRVRNNNIPLEMFQTRRNTIKSISEGRSDLSSSRTAFYQKSPSTNHPITSEDVASLEAPQQTTSYFSSCC